MESVTRRPGLALERGLAARLRSMVRGRAADPAWARPAILALLGGTAVLYVWGLDRNGWANSYYSAAVLAGTQSWKAFFYGAFDAGSFITVDKPPAALWLVALSARLFGFGSWSILLPEALLGVATVGLVFAIVRRQLGGPAGLVAAGVTALTPVAVVMFRFNNPDALLTFLMVAAAWALVAALRGGRTGWLLLSAALVGLAFDTKYLQAYIVLPALVITYFLLGPGTWLRRTWQLLAAGGALVASTGWWMTIVSLVPAASRPFIGGSTNDTVLDLVLGYDGFGRLTGALGGLGRGAAGAARGFAGGGPPGGGFGGAAGPLRLLNDQLGGEISWLLPLAAAALAVGLWARRGEPRTDPARAGYVLWGLWLLTHSAVFSFASGILHPYYSVAMAPAVGGLVGGGAVEAWRARSRWFPWAPVAAAALVVTAWWGSRLLARTPGFAPGLGALELALAAAAAAALLVPRGLRLPGGLRVPGRLPGAALAAGMAAVMLGPAAYSVATVGRPQNSPDPGAGPAAARAFAGFGPGGGGGRRFAGGPVASGPFPGGPLAGGQPARGGPPGAVGDGADSALIAYLEQHQGGATWLVATASANQAAPIALASGRPVLAMGGFSGGDPAMTVARLQELVRAGRLRFVLAGGGRGGPGAGSDSSQSVTEWVTQRCTPVGDVGSGLYDCSTAAARSGA